MKKQRVRHFATAPRDGREIFAFGFVTEDGFPKAIAVRQSWNKTRNAFLPEIEGFRPTHWSPIKSDGFPNGE